MQGRMSVVWAARAGPVARATLSQAHVVAAVLALPCAVAAVERAWTLAGALGLPLAVTLAGAAAAWRMDPPRDLRAIEAAAVFVLLFAGTAAAAVPGYLALGLGPVDALFESVSAITSTGLTVATGTMDWPLAGHALRAWMQWAGGFAIAVAGVALILGPGAARATAASLGRTGVPARDILSSTRAQARRLLKVYLAITAVAVAAFLPLFPAWWEAAAVALAAVSTGGMTPRPDSLESYSRAAQGAALLACLATAVSLMAYVEAGRSGPRAALQETNPGLVLALVLGAAATAAGLTLALGEGVAAATDAAFNMASGATTAGFSVAPLGPAPAVMALILGAMLVGGGAGSTAGGLKVERAALLARMVGVTLLRLRAPPGAVAPLEVQGARIGADRLTALGAVLFLYAASALACWVALTAGGVAPMPALFDTVSALSTVGLSLGAAGPDLAGPLKLVLAAAMLLGRLDFLVLIAVLSPRTWAPRHG